MRIRYVPVSSLELAAKRLPTRPLSSLSIMVKRGVYDLAPDLDALLLRSINKWGVVYPIVITSDGVVLDGVRRVNAVRLLYGDNVSVPAVVLDDQDASILLDATSMGLMGMGESMNVLAALGVQGTLIPSNYSVHSFVLYGDDAAQLIANAGLTVSGTPRQASIYVLSEDTP